MPTKNEKDNSTTIEEIEEYLKNNKEEPGKFKKFTPVFYSNYHQLWKYLIKLNNERKNKIKEINRLKDGTELRNQKEEITKLQTQLTEKNKKNLDLEEQLNRYNNRERERERAYQSFRKETSQSSTKRKKITNTKKRYIQIINNLTVKLDEVRQTLGEENQELRDKLQKLQLRQDSGYWEDNDEYETDSEPKNFNRTTQTKIITFSPQETQTDLVVEPDQEIIIKLKNYVRVLESDFLDAASKNELLEQWYYKLESLIRKQTQDLNNLDQLIDSKNKRLSQNQDDLTTAQAQIDLLAQDEATANRLWQEAEQNRREKEIYLNQLAQDFKTLLVGYRKLEEKLRLLQNKSQTLKDKNKTLKKQNKALQEQLNNRPAPQPKPPKRINKKTWFVGTGLTVAGLTYNYYNPGYSSANQLSILDNSTNNSLNLNWTNLPNPTWGNVPNSWNSVSSLHLHQLEYNYQQAQEKIINLEWQIANLKANNQTKTATITETLPPQTSIINHTETITPPPVILPPKIQKVTVAETSPTSTKKVKETETITQTATKTVNNTELVEELNQLNTDLEQEKETNPQFSAKINNWQTQIENIIGKLATAGISYLASKTRNKLQTKLKNEQTSHAKTKTERDNYYFQLISKEKQIIQQLNTDLNLNLTNPTLKQVVTKVKELINKPGTASTVITDNQSETLVKENQQLQETILNLQQQLTNSKTPFGEDLSTIKQLDLTSLEQLFPNQLENNFKSQILSATSYQQLVKTRQEFIQKHLNQTSDNLTVSPSTNNHTPSLKTERIIWLSLLVASLLTVGGLLMKLKKIKPSKKARLQN